MAGFYSKDLILEIFLDYGFRGLRAALVYIGVILTCVYRSRFLFNITMGSEFNSLRGFSDRNLCFLWGSSVLGVGAVFGGFIIQLISFKLNIFSFVRRRFKLGLLSRIILFFILGIIYLSSKKFKSEKCEVDSSKIFSLFKLFLGKIWLLPFIRGVLTRKIRIKSVNSRYKVGDLGWVENIRGGVGAKYKGQEGSRIIILSQRGIIVVYFIPFIIIFAALFFSYWRYHNKWVLFTPRR